MSSDVLEDFRIFVILSFQQHPSQIHVFQEESAQGEGVAFQSSVCASSGSIEIKIDECAGKERRRRRGGILSFLIPVADDASVSQQLEDAQQLESQQVSPLAPLLVLKKKNVKCQRERVNFKSGFVLMVKLWVATEINPPQVVSPGPLSSTGAALPLIPCVEIDTIQTAQDKSKKKMKCFDKNNLHMSATNIKSMKRSLREMEDMTVFFLECLKLKTATVTHSVVIPPLVATLIPTDAGQQVFLLHYLIGSDPFREENKQRFARTCQ